MYIKHVFEKYLISKWHPYPYKINKLQKMYKVFNDVFQGIEKNDIGFMTREKTIQWIAFLTC